ncbi:hypothetical protein EJD97_025095 [Solanum chilense]|uniref:Uncharacterized protein n=1 Tax=Solanum chilense TaxID=4083 RepID=A0A6N2ARZ8_SOLCI|nr:hypothetical protein EJD97_025095 [Solanum chilense]
MARTKTTKEGHIPDLFNPSFYAVVHPWITPTKEELQMSYLITLGLVETIFDPVEDRVKMVLVGATIIRRERVPNEVNNELVVFYGTAVDDGAGVGAAAAGSARQHEGATSCRRCCGFLCEKCKKHDEDFIMYLQKLSEAVNDLKKRGVKDIVSKNVRHAYTPKAKRRK